MSVLSPMISDDEDRYSAPPSNEGESSVKKPIATKTCKVCGDKAFGYNFNVVTCESCKAFFRRNAAKEKEFRCPFTNSCEINLISRRFCQRCRLQKCFDVGMKKEWIVADERRRKKRERKGVKGDQRRRRSADSDFEEGLGQILQKTSSTDTSAITIPKNVLFHLLKNSNSMDANARRPACCQCRCTCGFYQQGTQLTALEPQANYPSIAYHFNQDQSSNNSNNTSQFECAPSMTDWFGSAVANGTAPSISMALSATSSSSPVTSARFLQQIPGFGAGVGSGLDAGLFNMMSATINSEFDAGSPPGSIEGMNMNNTSKIECPASCCQVASPDSTFAVQEALTLTSEQQNRLDELIRANDVLKEPLREMPEQLRALSKKKGEFTLMDVVRMTDLAIRRLIKWSKRLKGFQTISQEDQIALLKGSCSEMLILRGVMAFDPTKDVWNHPDTEGDATIKLDVLKPVRGGKHYEEHKRYLTTFSPRWRTNEKVMLILNAITLFCPDRQNLKKPEVVRKEQEQYYVLLRRYLETQCSEGESRQTYDHLLRKLVDLHQLNQEILRIYGDLNPKEVDPLLLEMFDLKC